MRRILTIWCPDWPVVAAGRHDEPAIVLHANRVVARSAMAAADGVEIGQRRRTAQRRCPDAVLLDHDLDRDALAFEPAARAVGRFSPRVDVVAPGLLCLDARGPSRYFGGDAGLTASLGESLRDAVPGIVAGVGCADGRFASAVAAHRAADLGRPLVVPPGGSPTFLAPLSTRWLDTVHQHEQAEQGDTAGFVDLVARLGVTRLGGLVALDARDLLARFGEIGVWARRLAAGDDDRPPNATDPPPDWQVEHVFDDPIEQMATVVFTAKSLADHLAATLSANGATCTRLVVIAETDHGERSERAWYRATGLSAAAMVERVRWQLDGWAEQPGEISAGIVLVRLIPHEIRRDDGEQHGLWGGRSEADDRALRAVTRLIGLVGDAGVLVPAWNGGRLPGERYHWVPAAGTDLTEPADRLAGAADADVPWPGALPAPSPTVVPTEPQPVDVTDEIERPILVDGRGTVSAAPHRLGQRRITAWAGPWPVDQRWWSSDRHRRLARFQVVLDDGQAHLLMVEQQRWWIAGTYS
jgi:protein ImuB